MGDVDLGHTSSQEAADNGRLLQLDLRFYAPKTHSSVLGDGRYTWGNEGGLLA